MYAGAAVAVLIVFLWVAVGQPIAGIAFGQGAAFGMALVFAAVVLDRSRKRR
jgi:hypothetical protein